MKDSEPRRCFMDGIDWQHHLDGDVGGTTLYPDVEACHDGKTCIKDGGCGLVEVEVRLIRWVEPQNLFGESDGHPSEKTDAELTPEGAR